MKRLQYLAAAIILSSLLFTSCAPTLSPFTEHLYEENNWNENQLKQIQFYLSSDIVLYKEVSEGASQIIEGEIKVVDGRKRDQITFKKGTPGVFLFSPKDNHFAVSFEDGGNDRYLVFGPNPNTGNKYVLLASKWERRRGSVSYAGDKWAVDATAAYSTLLVDLKRLQQNKVSTRVASGRKIGG